MNASDFQQIYISIDFFFCSACVIFMIKFGSYMYICTWLCSLSFFTVLYLFCFHVLCDYAVHDWDQESLKCMSTYFCHCHAAYLYPLIILLQLFEHMNLSVFSNNMQRRIWYGVYRESSESINFKLPSDLNITLGKGFPIWHY